MPIHNCEMSVRHKRRSHGACESCSLRHAMKCVRYEHKISRLRYHLVDIISVSFDKLAIVMPFSTRRTWAKSRKLRSISIEVTCRASLAICNVNQPSPEHRSITSMPDVMPTWARILAGSGHSASHQPAVGISVPLKNPGSTTHPYPCCCTIR